MKRVPINHVLALPERRNERRPMGFSEAWDDFVREVDLASLDIDPDEVFAGVRDDAPGRETDCWGEK